MTTREQLQAEADRLTKIIERHDAEHRNALVMANLFRKQRKTVERALAALPDEQPTGEAIKEIAEGLKEPK